MRTFKEYMVDADLTPATATVYNGNVTRTLKSLNLPPSLVNGDESINLGAEELSTYLTGLSPTNATQVSSAWSLFVKYKGSLGATAPPLTKNAATSFQQSMISPDTQMALYAAFMSIWSVNGVILPNPLSIQALSLWTLGTPTGSLVNGAPFTRTPNIADLKTLTWGGLKQMGNDVGIIPVKYLDAASLAASFLGATELVGWKVGRSLVDAVRLQQRRSVDYLKQHNALDRSTWHGFHHAVYVVGSVGNPLNPLSNAEAVKAFDIKRIEDVLSMLTIGDVNYNVMLTTWAKTALRG